ncbi:MAG: DUF4286 family protein, partial [Chitinophagaceae bacterium]
VDWSIHEDWLLWMKTIHIPEVMASGCFTHSQMVRLLETDEHDGPSYAVQYFAATKSDYNRYIEFHAALLRQKAFDRWGDKFVSFRSLMQIVQ